MVQRNHDEKARKEAMKRLRQERKETIARVSAGVKNQKKVTEAISGMLREGGRTVPELAAGTGLPTSEVLWTIASLKKYGGVVEREKDGAYFRYMLAEPAGVGMGIDQESPEGDNA